MDVSLISSELLFKRACFHKSNHNELVQEERKREKDLMSWSRSNDGVAFVSSPNENLTNHLIYNSRPVCRQKMEQRNSRLIPMCFVVAVAVSFNMPAKSNGNLNLPSLDFDDFPIPIGMYIILLNCFVNRIRLWWLDCFPDSKSSDQVL